MTTSYVPVFNSYHVSVVANAQGVPICNPATLAVSGSNVMISFDLELAGYDFPDTEVISFSGPTDQFPASWRLSPTQFILVDYNGVQGSDVYTLNIRNTATGEIFPIDPIIVNED